MGIVQKVVIIFCFLNLAQATGQASQYYQLKEYTFDSSAQEKLTDDYLENAFIPALKELDIQNIGVFKPIPSETDTLSTRKTYVLIPFSSLVQFRLVEEALATNATHQTNGQAYLAASHDAPPYARIASTLMKAFTDMPKMKPSPLQGPRKERIYELRSYESATEALYKKKVDMFNAGGEIRLFEKLGFNAVFYAEVLSGAHMPNLMYMTTHANREARDANWKAFVDSAEWNKLKVMPKYQHTVSRNDTRLLYPTAYSDY